MRTRLLALVLLGASLPGTLAAAPPARRSPPPPEAAPAPRFMVIVHPANVVESVSRKQLADLFLKKVTRWPDGATVHPVEPPETSLARAYFLSDVMGGKSAFAMKVFWNKRVLSGREVPPVQKGSDEEVAAFVRATPGAIGYLISATTPLRVKVVELTD